MSSTLGDLLDDARERSFVGRTDELRAFEAALAGGAATRLLFVHGPGGVGKTTLLGRCRSRAAAQGRVVLEFDGRDHGLTREVLSEATQTVSGGADPVLLIDGYEQLAHLDAWLRAELLPSLPAGSVTVIAGREPPGIEWRSDPGWRELMSVHRLQDFEDDEADEFLQRVGVPEPARRQLVQLSHGLPLALALLADLALAGQVPSDLADAPDVVAALLPVFVQSVPSDEHAAALELCSHTWVTTFDLLTYCFGDRADEMWHWLGSRPFVARTGAGLYPHDLARDVLLAEHARRGTRSQQRVQRMLHRYARERMQALPAADAYVVALQLLFLHRDRPVNREFWNLRDNQGVAVAPGRMADHRDVVDLVRRREGEAEATLVDGWLQVQPDALRVIRRDGRLEAFTIELLLPAGTGLEADDAATRSVLETVRERGPLRPGEQLSIGRFFGGDSDAYQTDPLAVVCGSVGSLVNWQVRPLAWSWVVTIAPELWDAVFDYLGFEHRAVLPGEPARVAYGMDWRRIDVTVWLDVMAERELTGDTGPMPASLLRPPPLARDTFDQAVRDALGQLRSPDRLADSALMGTQIASDGGRADVERLQDTIRWAIDEVGSIEANDELRRVLDRTFLHGTPSQEAAAELLSMSYSTYRRRLAKAIEALTDVLWAVEIGRRVPDLAG